MSGITLPVLLLLLPATVFCGIVHDLVYSCNPTGTITVDNPDPSRFTNAYARTVDGTQNCSALPLFFHNTIIISECSISRNITLWLFDSKTAPEIITGEQNFYIIRCQQIPATGIYRRVTDESWVTNYLSTSIAPSVTPRIPLNTQIEDIESGIERTSAILGEPLRWEIDGPVNYFVLPLNCTAVAGDTSDMCSLVLNGCSQDTNLLSHFERVPGQPHILHAKLFAFRFASSSTVLFICDMLGCHNQSSSCDINCPSDKKRRDVVGEEGLGEVGQNKNIVFRREVRLERNEVRRNKKNVEVRRAERDQESEETQGDLVGQVSFSLEISDPALAPLIQRGSAPLPLINVVLLTLAAVASSLLWD